MKRMAWKTNLAAALVAGVFAAGPAAAQQAQEPQPDAAPTPEQAAEPQDQTAQQAPEPQDQTGQQAAEQQPAGQQDGAQVAQQDQQRMSPAVVRKMQKTLNEMGYDAGRLDGVLGPQTRAALREFQRDRGLDPSGQPTEETLAALDVEPIRAELPRERREMGIDAETQRAEIAAAEARAQQDFAEQIYFGFGLMQNSLDDFDEAVGWQILAGWDPGFRLDRIRGAIEVGFMSSGDFESETLAGQEVDAEGVWATAVGFLPINENWQALARAGADFGDDDGAMFGFGVDYGVSETVHVRGEYVTRDEIDSLQVNLIWRPY